MSDKANKVDTLISIAEGTAEFIDENRDLIESVVGAEIESNSTVSLKDNEPLIDAQKSEDEVVISAETELESEDEVDLSLNIDEYSLVIEAGSKSIEALIPDDCEPGQLESTVNNGVLTVRVPRTDEGGDSEVEEDGTP